MTQPSIARHIELFRRDAARWVEPEEIVPVGRVTLSVALRLLVRHPPLRAMAWFRLGQFARMVGIRGVSGYVQRRLLRLYGLELAPGTPVGGGLYIAHSVGCVLHAASIGDDVTVVGQVTLGTRDDGLWPTVADRAYLGVGVRVLGGVTIGSDSQVGANAVVLQDVPDGATAVGIPARIISANRSAGAPS